MLLIVVNGEVVLKIEVAVGIVNVVVEGKVGASSATKTLNLDT